MRESLREVILENVFDSPTIEVFKEIEGTNDVNTYTDVSVLHETRELYYLTVYDKLFSSNLDTRTGVI